MVKKSGVEMSSLYKVKGHFNPGGLKLGVEKSGVEMSFNPMYSFRKILSVKESKGFMM